MHCTYSWKDAFPAVFNYSISVQHITFLPKGHVGLTVNIEYFLDNLVIIELSTNCVATLLGS